MCRTTTVNRRLTRGEGRIDASPNCGASNSTEAEKATSGPSGRAEPAHEFEEVPPPPQHVITTSLEALPWLARFVSETPGDEVEGGRPRQVPGKCWSKVTPTPAPDPHLALWSTLRGD